ncbi:MAG TPA: ArsR family transcriptional regulator [Gemmatimonadaceae bacterium]|nr:ArsR family transcriptional regulator [Gemmatimonadaceae bacterium]
MPDNRRSKKSSVGDRTRGRLLALLREGSWTVDDLAGQLELTDNAVRFHLDALEAAGSVEKNGVRRTGVGQPAVLYSLSAAGEEAFSKAYAPVLIATLAELRERMAPSELMRLLKRIGKRLARSTSASSGSLGSRATHASQLLNELGGVTVVEKKADGYLIVGRACPLSRAVEEDHCVCAAVTSLVADVVGAEVTECCDRSGRPKCRFEIKPGTATRAIAH